MIYTNYKIWFTKRNDDGFITEVAIRVFEGEYQDKEVEDENGNVITKNVFVMTKRLESFDELSHFAKDGELRGTTENTGKFCVYFNTSDFGSELRTDEEITTFLNGEIKKDTLREVIDEQK